MISLYPHVRATLKAHAYFATTLGGFTDSQGNFKVFMEDDAPTAETIFITIEQPTVEESRNTSWSSQQAIFHVTGKDTDLETLWSIARKIRDIFRSAPYFTAIGTADPVPFMLTGPSITGSDTDPVTENRIVSVTLTFGVQDDS